MEIGARVQANPRPTKASSPSSSSTRYRWQPRSSTEASSSTTSGVLSQSSPVSAKEELADRPRIVEVQEGIDAKESGSEGITGVSANVRLS